MVGYMLLALFAGFTLFDLCLFFTSPSPQWLEDMGRALIRGPLEPSIPRALALSFFNVVLIALSWGFGHLVFRAGSGPPLSGENHSSFFQRLRGAWAILVIFSMLPGLGGASVCLAGMTDGTIQAYPIFLLNLLSPAVCFAALALTALKKKSPRKATPSIPPEPPGPPSMD